MAPALPLQASSAAGSGSVSAGALVKATSYDGDGPSWAELLGSNNWDGLLDPLDMSLRKWILRWGDLAQVTYDAFNLDDGSKYCGSSRYGKADILSRTFYPFAADYVGAELLYATLNGKHPTTVVPQAFSFSTARDAWSMQSNFQGYMAVSTDEYTLNNGGRREICVAWRGTETAAAWLNNIKFPQTPVKYLQPTTATMLGWAPPLWLPWISDEPKVMLGWYNIYTEFDPESQYGHLSARMQLLTKIKELVEQYKDDDLSIVCVGHSLGGAIAVLSAFDIVLQGLSKKASTDDEYFPVTAVVFSSPRVGNKAFDDMMKSMPNLHVFNVKNLCDIVPALPPRYCPFVGDYVDPGVSFEVDSRVSPYLKDTCLDLGDFQNLQGLLHTVAGWNGDAQGGFKLVLNRSVALVNKSSGYLNAEHGIPTNWWAEKNKGMVYNESTGEWTLEQDEQAFSPEVPTVLLRLSALNAKAVAKSAKVIAIANGGSAAHASAMITAN